MQPTILPPRPEELLGPLLASLPAASISPQPPTALLPLLSPILRQRVQLLSESTQDPWLPLLCYDSTTATKLENVVKNERLEPHPVSGEVEVDWESELDVQYRRLDEETLQSLITLRDLELAVKLVYCVNDEVGGGDGWRIGEVNVVDPSLAKWGHPSIGIAESNFSSSSTQQPRGFAPANGRLPTPDAEDDGDDDDYWAQYDNTPAQTPGPEASSTAQSNRKNGVGMGNGTEDEDSYYAQYATVQPALDNHDPDEAQQNGEVESSLGRDEITSELHNNLTSSNDSYSSQNEQSSGAVWSDDFAREPDYMAPAGSEFVAQPRPSSSHGSSGSDTVARLEKVAEEEEQTYGRGTSELGIKQHIGTSIKSLWRLAKVSGIDREEFERVVRTELECIGMLDEDGD